MVKEAFGSAKGAGTLTIPALFASLAFDRLRREMKGYGKFALKASYVCAHLVCIKNWVISYSERNYMSRG